MRVLALSGKSRFCTRLTRVLVKSWLKDEWTWKHRQRSRRAWWDGQINIDGDRDRDRGREECKWQIFEWMKNGSESNWTKDIWKWILGSWSTFWCQNLGLGIPHSCLSAFSVFSLFSFSSSTSVFYVSHPFLSFSLSLPFTSFGLTVPSFYTSDKRKGYKEY